jgi:DNA-binding NarL/FixJ family response regulator
LTARHSQAICVIAGAANVRHALVARLRHFFGEPISALPTHTNAQLEHGTVVITTARDSPIECCKAMVDEGLRVIVLATKPNAAAARAFEAVGVGAYLPMELDLGPLLAAVREASGSSA